MKKILVQWKNWKRLLTEISLKRMSWNENLINCHGNKKGIKEVVKYIQICISKREHYEGYRKNPNDKIYMMMNRKDVESYQKSYEEIDIFLKQFLHLKDTALERLKKNQVKNFSENLTSILKNCKLSKRILLRNIIYYQSNMMNRNTWKPIWMNILVEIKRGKRNRLLMKLRNIKEK